MDYKGLIILIEGYPCPLLHNPVPTERIYLQWNKFIYKGTSLFDVYNSFMFTTNFIQLFTKIGTNISPISGS